MAKLDPDDPHPPYRQVADRIRAAIDTGEYPPGVKLPSYDALATELGHRALDNMGKRLEAVERRLSEL